LHAYSLPGYTPLIPRCVSQNVSILFYRPRIYPTRRNCNNELDECSSKELTPLISPSRGIDSINKPTLGIIPPKRCFSSPHVCTSRSRICNSNERMTRHSRNPITLCLIASDTLRADLASLHRRWGWRLLRATRGWWRRSLSSRICTNTRQS